MPFFGGIAVLAVFCYIESQVPDPMFNLRLFKIRPFTMGNIAGLFAAVGRGGLQFMLIIWLQGVWLPCTATASSRRRCGPASS